MQLYPASRGYILAVWAVVRNLSHASSHSESVASARKVNATPASCWNAILLLVRLFEKYS